jgi:hypothetical protein
MRWYRFGLVAGLGAVMASVVPACGGASCKEGGRTYEDGASWTCSDGCNYCSCDDGVVSSTTMACGGAGGGGGKAGNGARASGGSGAQRDAGGLPDGG